MGSAAQYRFLGCLGASVLLGCGQTEPNNPAPWFVGATSTTGGSSTGGASAGGASAGGASAGGTVGRLPEPETSLAGQPANNQLWPSIGCGKPTSQIQGFPVQFSVHVSGATLDPSFRVPAHERKYKVTLPPNYDAMRPHRTLYTSSGCFNQEGDDGRFAPQLSHGGDIISVGLADPPRAIGDDSCIVDGSAKSTEWEYFALVTSEVERTFCVDKNNELVAGAHAGATLANLLACYFGAVDPNRAFGSNLRLRGQLSIATDAPQERPACAGPIAALFMHDVFEGSNPMTSTLAELDRAFLLNGCAKDAWVMWGEGDLAGVGCLKNTTCPTNQPIFFCQTMGKGNQSNYNAISVPALVQFWTYLDTWR